MTPTRQELIEEAFKAIYQSCLNIAFMISQDSETAKDCVMEAVTRTLEMSFPVTSFQHAKNILVTQTRWTAVNFVKRRSMMALHAKSIYEESITFQDDTTGALEYYPLANMLKDKFKDLYAMNKLALESYMHNIPPREMARLYNINEDTFKTSLQRAIHQLREKIKKRKVIADDITDRIMGLLETGLSKPEIARALDISLPSLHSRVTTRQKRSK